MPCDTITTQSINLKNAISSLLAEAMKRDGWNIHIEEENKIVASAYDGVRGRVEWTKGVGFNIQAISVKKSKEIAQKITKDYSKQAISWAAKRAGWTVKITGEDTLTVQRR